MALIPRRATLFIPLVECEKEGLPFDSRARTFFNRRSSPCRGTLATSRPLFVHRLGGLTADTQHVFLPTSRTFLYPTRCGHRGTRKWSLPLDGLSGALCMIAYTRRTSCSNISMLYRYSGGRLGRVSAISQRQGCSNLPPLGIFALGDLLLVRVPKMGRRNALHH